jgi:tetratricopeptide (TPR) repeat protein
MNKFLLSLLLLLSACHRVPEELEPKINYAVQDRYLKELPAPFSPLTAEEREEPWGREYLIGQAFARQLDLYQAITAFRRAEILIPETLIERKTEIDYEILLCYYLGGKYSDVVNTFEHSRLQAIDHHFPACHDLLIILYDTYIRLGEDEKAAQILLLIKQSYPEAAEELSLSTALSRADLPAIRSHTTQAPYMKTFLDDYERGRKSIQGAEALNALLPGAGYLYVGQQQSALTAFLLNGLFIAAAYHFFHKGEIAAGVIFTSFEAGWYFGGIYGGGEEAKFYNERLYEKRATPLMNQNKLFPALMLNYAF